MSNFYKDNTYLHNKDKLSEERRKELESGMEVYFYGVAKGIDPITQKTTWEETFSMTRNQIAKYIEINITLDIQGSHTLGFNYDINGNKM